MLKSRVKPGSAILNRKYSWPVERGKCQAPPEVCYRPDEDSSRQRLDPRKAAGGGSHVFDLLRPGLCCLKNFCGGGFRFEARVRVTERGVDIPPLPETAEA